MKRLIAFICVLCMLCISCKVTRTVIDTVTVHDTVRTHVTLYDTVVVQRIDTLHVYGNDIMYSLDSAKAAELASKLDDATAELLIKDTKIKALLYQLSNNKLCLDPVWAYAKYAKACAGLTDNRLWVELYLDSLAYVNTTSIDSVLATTNTSTTITTTEEKKQTVWANPWFYASLGAIACILVLLILVLKRRL